MKKLILIIFIAVTLNAQERSLNLEESLRIGMTNSKELKISRSKLNYTDSKITEIRSQFLPQFKLTGNYTRLSDNIPPFEVSMPFAPLPIRISDPIINIYSVRFGFSQPIFTGFRLSSLKNSADLNLRASEYDYSKDEIEKAFNVFTAFWNFYKTGEIKKAIKQNLDQMEKHLRDTKVFYDNGLVSTNDLLKLEVQRSNTKLMLLEAENNFNLARIMFNKAVGLELTANTSVTVDEKILEESDFELAEISAEAFASRNELKSLSKRIEASEKGISAAKSYWLPSVYLNGNYYYSNPNPRFQPARNKFDSNWDLSVSLNWDVWNWGFTSSQVLQAEETKIQLEITLEQIKESIQAEVYSNYLTFLKSSEKLNLSRLMLTQAKENYRVTVEKYNVQLATSTELIDAETLKLQAETNLKTSEVDYQIAKVSLEKSIGRPIPK
ncbi:MAG TPA: TolC family protein [Melioribacteraceae bacterium]|nr:TolC family protein [Melioribacteraceae bacterium]